MKKTLLTATAIALVICAGSGLAADLPSRKDVPVYVPPPPSSLWAGLYVGINGGYGGNSIDRTTTSSSPGYFSSFSDTFGAGGPFVGGQIGYNYVLSNHLVLGGEVDIDWANVINYNGTSNTSGVTAFASGGGLAAVSTTGGNSGTGLDWLGTARLRLGYDLGKFLPYVTGGVAFGGLSSTNYAYSTFGGLGGSVTSGNTSTTQVGWAVGAGAEYMITDSWSVKAEYLYTQIGGITRNDTTLGAGVTTVSIGNFGIHQVRGGLNYHFNWGAPPILAKY